MSSITVRDVTRSTVLAQGQAGQDAILLEGCYYFDPEQVAQEHLIVTERTYTCPYKGVCQWIDLDSPTGTIRDVAWVYTRPKPKYEYIRDKIGFAYGMRPGVLVEKD